MVAIHQSPCDPQQLRLLIQDRLSSRRKTHLIEHLDECTSCCRRLEQLAAGAAFWSDTQVFLCEETEKLASPPHCKPEKSCFPGKFSGATGSASVDPDGHWQSQWHTLGCGQEAALSLPPGPNTAPTDALIALTLDSLEPPGTSDALGRIDEYEILEVIGRGGSGVVLKGYQRDLNRMVAVKVLSPHVAGNGAARKRFEREAKAAAAVVHPHVVAIHGINSAARLPYLVMHWVQGSSLEQRLHRDGPLPLRDILRIAQQVAEGLAAAHDQGLVHRDIKPANILLEKDVDRVLITDFGLARAVDDATLTCTGMIAGTPAYMSPEQTRGETVGAASDLFSLGSVMHAMCTGESPYPANSTVAILRRVCDGQPRDITQLNPEIPHWLVLLIARLHEKDVNRRLGSAREVATLLKQCLAHVQQPDRVSLPNELQRPRPLWRRPVAIIAAGTLLLAAGYRLSQPAEHTESLTPPRFQVEEPIESQPNSVARPTSLSDLSWRPETTNELNSIESGIEELGIVGDDLD